MRAEGEVLRSDGVCSSVGATLSGGGVRGGSGPGPLPGPVSTGRRGPKTVVAAPTQLGTIEQETRR